MNIYHSPIDYDTLLNVWAEKVFVKAEEASERRDESFSFKDGYNKGMYDAFYLAVTMLTTEEDKAKARNK